MRGITRGVMVNVLDCNLVVSQFQFQLQLRCYVHLKSNTFKKDAKPLSSNKLWIN